MKKSLVRVKEEIYKLVMKAGKNCTAIILELKKDDKVDNALKQIKEKKYSMKFIKENEGRKILVVGICYNSKTKEHECKIEELN